MIDIDGAINETDNQSFLTFRLGNLKFAINVLNVREIFHLSELTPVEEMPDYMAGVMNLRGKIIPVMDLNLRFGRPRERYMLTDRIVTIVTEDGNMTGVIVSEIHDVLTIPGSATEQPPSFGHEKESLASFVVSLAKMGSDILMILDLERLVHFSRMTDQPEKDGEVLGDAGEKLVFCPEASPEEMAVFHARSVELMGSSGLESISESIPVAVADISGEFYGIDLASVQEFAMIHGITPVPCCPAHIIGNMNLRGNVLTLIDIRGVFDLQFSDAKSEAKAIVVSSGDIVVGLAVDDILDIIHIHPSEMVQSPSGLREGKEKYIRGTAPYEGRVMSIINIPKILAGGELTVNEEI